MRQQVREAKEYFPPNGSCVEAVIESCVEDKIGTRRVGHGPQIPDCVAAQKWLREVPDFSCQRETPY
jgi:hypothetical protein